MPEFEITFEHTSTYTQVVEAEDEHEARDLADFNDAEFVDGDWDIVDIEEL